MYIVYRKPSSASKGLGRFSITKSIIIDIYQN